MNRFTPVKLLPLILSTLLLTSCSGHDSSGGVEFSKTDNSFPYGDCRGSGYQTHSTEETGCGWITANDKSYYIMPHANYPSANFTNANLTGANLSRSILRGANLTNANLTNAILNNNILRSANLTNANLTNANLANAVLRNANLHGANLTGADTSGAILQCTTLTTECHTDTPDSHPTDCTSSSYHYDESNGVIGEPGANAHACLTNCDCDGRRTCNREGTMGWCQGTAR